MEIYTYSLVWYGHSKVALRNIVRFSLHVNSMVWHGNTMMLWYGVWILWPAWYGMTGHYSVILCGRYGIVWHGMASMVCYGMVWYGIVRLLWYSMAWYGQHSMVW